MSRRSTRFPAALATLVAGLLASCASPSLPARSGDAAPSVSATDGWEVLFDGALVRGLRGYGQDTIPADRWQVEGGRLRTIPGAGVDLITVATYRDVEVELTWAVSPGGNSGLLYGVAETGQPAWTSGPEYQLLDDAGHPDGREPTTSAGALYDLIAPGPSKRLAPVGEDNVSRIVVRGGHVEHWLNHELVLAFDWGSADLASRIAASKFAGMTGFMASIEGHIVIQHHGDTVSFGLIRVRRI
jgi:hypothetical protein